MSKLISQHTVHVRENHPVFLPGPTSVNVYQADAGHYFVRVHAQIVANFLTLQRAEDYTHYFIDSVGETPLYDRAQNLLNRLSNRGQYISYVASRSICEANLDPHIRGDYNRDIELLAAHLRKD